MHSSTQPQDLAWQFWLALPLYPFGKRRTLCTEVVQDTIWTFDQLQGFFYAVVTIRMTVVKLNAGGLLIYAPVAPTKECIRMVNELVAKYGDVKYIILPTSSGLEHKIFVGPFARCFPQAQVFVAPNQWSFPLNLPLSWLGFPRKRTQVLPENSKQAPFGAEFDYAVLDLDLGKGSFAEVALLHRRSRTLLLTDSIISIPEEPPALLQLDPYPLLFHARDSGDEAIEDTPANRRKGWQRICLFAIYFRPRAVETSGLVQMWRDVAKAKERSRQAYFGLYPFRWQAGWQQSFNQLRGNGRPFVAPILQTLIFPQAPKQVLDWADKVATWDFGRIISCHLDAPIATTPDEFRQAFACLEQNARTSQNAPLPEEDFGFLRQLETFLVRYGVATPVKEKV
ncbi:DUF4336 domain-containing protein [Chroococcidiopsis sp. FACHB-1243]|uniref:DUF4336 domain-containing protein n=1 Tax=Chroococcidiopsis sp. [FACHB-1243] TaxID=2692781 RepID=UPI00178214C8|nr:DUF4336 domain-containing protein [Chroococcidiopsis sp. [FACHB-1243]]MBD2308539.1 DUF4336 domain-containing protein [Chroococcidiopsis sp. [FACHB-1243]]